MYFILEPIHQRSRNKTLDYESSQEETYDSTKRRTKLSYRFPVRCTCILMADAVMSDLVQRNAKFSCTVGVYWPVCSNTLDT